MKLIRFEEFNKGKPGMHFDGIHYDVSDNGRTEQNSLQLMLMPSAEKQILSFILLLIPLLNAMYRMEK